MKKNSITDFFHAKISINIQFKYFQTEEKIYLNWDRLEMKDFN